MHFESENIITGETPFKMHKIIFYYIFFENLKKFR